jgi:hypothetical protein
MKVRLVFFAIALAALFVAFSQTKGSDAKKSQLDGNWELVSGQPLPKGTRDIKMISGGHFIFVAYDTEKGKPLYTGGGTCILNGSSYTEHMDFASDQISAGLIGKDQPFTVKIDGDTFTQTGTLSNGKGLSETWKRMN